MLRYVLKMLRKQAAVVFWVVDVVALLLTLFILLFSMIPVHAQSLVGAILEHRLTTVEQQNFSMAASLADLKLNVSALSNKIDYAIWGLVVLIIRPIAEKLSKILGL